MSVMENSLLERALDGVTPLPTAHAVIAVADGPDTLYRARRVWRGAQ
jgi:hypothetical protein